MQIYTSKHSKWYVEEDPFGGKELLKVGDALTRLKDPVYISSKDLKENATRYKITMESRQVSLEVGKAFMQELQKASAPLDKPGFYWVGLQERNGGYLIGFTSRISSISEEELGDLSGLVGLSGSLGEVDIDQIEVPNIIPDSLAKEDQAKPFVKQSLVQRAGVIPDNYTPDTSSPDIHKYDSILHPQKTESKTSIGRWFSFGKKKSKKPEQHKIVKPSETMAQQRSSSSYQTPRSYANVGGHGTPGSSK